MSRSRAHSFCTINLFPLRSFQAATFSFIPVFKRTHPPIKAAPYLMSHDSTLFSFLSSPAQKSLVFPSCFSQYTGITMGGEPASSKIISSFVLSHWKRFYAASQSHALLLTASLSNTLFHCHPHVLAQTLTRDQFHGQLAGTINEGSDRIRYTGGRESSTTSQPRGNGKTNNRSPVGVHRSGNGHLHVGGKPSSAST